MSLLKRIVTSLEQEVAEAMADAEQEVARAARNKTALPKHHAYLYGCRDGLKKALLAIRRLLADTEE